MTICVGIICEDGVVLGSDSMCSLNLMNTNFIALNNVKTNIIDESLIFSYAGNNDIDDLFFSFLKSEYKNIKANYSTLDSEFFAAKIRMSFIQYIQNLYDVKSNNVNLDLFNKFFTTTSFETLIGFQLQGKYYLHCFSITNGKIAFETIRNEATFYKIIGSGILQGNPSIHLMRKILNLENKNITVSQAVNLIYWTIEHSIECSSGGLGKPIIISTLKNNKSEYVETLECQSYIKEFYEHISKFEIKTKEEIKKDESIDEIPKLSNKN